MNGHRSDIKHRHLEKPLANLFISEGHSLEDLSMFVIEQIHWEEANFHKAKESYWVQTPFADPQGTEPRSIDH